MATTTKATSKETLSTITKAMEQAHQIIKAETGAMPATILITRNLKNARAHFTTWTPWTNETEQFHEIALNAEIFAEGAKSVLGSLLHEVAHSLNHQNGIKDCSSNQYHNNNFKMTAEAIGLKTSEVKGKGFARTELTDEGMTRWAKAFSVIDCALKLSAIGESKAKPKGRNTNLLKAECGCGQTIRASRAVINSGVSCNQCETTFETEVND
jgi:predicted SprT family Zn-dependent metalloprotease